MAKRGRKKKFKVNFNVSPSSLRSVLAVVLLLSSVLVVISFLVPDYFINQKIQMVTKKIFGYSAWIIPLIMAVTGLIFIDALKHKIKESRVVLGLVTLLIGVSGILHLFISSDEAKQAAIDGRGGGYVGYYIASFLKSMVSVYGAIFILLALSAVAIILTFNVSIDQIIEFYREKVKTGDIFKFKKMPKDEIEVQEGMGEFEEVDQTKKLGGLPFSESTQDAKQAKKIIEESFEIVPTIAEPQIGREVMTGGKDESLVSIAPGSLPYTDKVWKLPGLDILEDSKSGPPDTGDVEHNKKVIKETLGSFGVPTNIVDVQIGPAVTKYALETPPGIKIAKVANLQYDLALALASPTGSVRVEAPIPGKALIGIEVPNRTRSMVDFKSMISSEPMKNAKSKISIALGKDVGGVSHIYDIGKMPHLLIAGATGSGKSIFIHNLILSILFRATPQEVKLILMDFKRGVELSNYEDIPHLLTPLVTDIEKAPAVFKWAESEMERRFKMFQSARAKNIESYNEKSGFQALPYILLIVDELADIMIMDPTAVEKSIIRLAQLARATGIHLVLAVQRPSADVITGLIKANIPCRIAFNVTRQVDSRVIIDQSGAEKLLGQGDMLFVPPDKPNPVRLQGAFVSDTEKARLSEFLKNQGVTPDYKEEILETPSDETRGKSIAAGGESTDPKYEEASEIIIAAGKGSASLLQRRLSIGYARAARIIDELEQNGIVGPAQGSKARSVLVDSLPIPGSDVDSDKPEPFDDFDVDE